MNFERAMDECRKAGGGRIQDSQCNTWRVNTEGDPIKICGCDCVAGYDWKCLPDQPQPAPQPELMTGIEAMFAVFKQGGGEIWREVPDEKLEHRATISANCVITKGTTLGLSETQRLYAVRPLPPETFDFTEAMARLMRGEKVKDDTGRIFLPRLQVIPDGDIDDDDFPLYYPMANCKDKQFTAVET